MSSKNTDWARSYYADNYRKVGVHLKGQRIVPPANVERREFHEPCFMCGDRGACRHRRSLLTAST